MNYFKDNNNNPYVYLEGLLSKEDWVTITEEELNISLTKITKEQFDQLVYEINNPPKTPEEIALEEHDYKSKQVDDYVNQLVITTSSGKRFKANYQALTSINIILKSDYPEGIIPIWKQRIGDELVYHDDLPLIELSEVVTEANKRIQAKHLEIFSGKPNPYASEEV